MARFLEKEKFIHTLFLINRMFYITFDVFSLFFQLLYHRSADYSKVCAPFQPKQDQLGVACHRGNCQNNSVEV